MIIFFSKNVQLLTVLSSTNFNFLGHFLTQIFGSKAQGSKKSTLKVLPIHSDEHMNPPPSYDMYYHAREQLLGPMPTVPIVPTMRVVPIVRALRANQKYTSR